MTNLAYFLFKLAYIITNPIDAQLFCDPIDVCFCLSYYHRNNQTMISNSPPPSDQLKVQLFQFHEDKWTEVAIGWLLLDSEKQLLNVPIALIKIHFGEGFSTSSFPLFMNALYS